MHLRFPFSERIQAAISDDKIQNDRYTKWELKNHACVHTGLRGP